MNTDRYCDRVSELVEHGFTGGEMPSQWGGIVSVVEDMGLSVTRVRHDTFAVYKPDEHFIRGTIGYGNYFDFSEADNPDRFMVGARHIRNGRYSAQSRQHTMRLSKNLNTAAKAARTYLTPVSVQEITRFYLESIQRAHKDLMDDRVMKRRAATDKFLVRGDYELRNSPKFMDELLNLVNSSYIFKDAELKTSIKEWAEYHKDIKLMEEKQHTMRLIVMEHGKIKVTTPFDPMNGSLYTLKRSLEVDFTEYPVKEALPTELLSKLAVLFVVEEGRFTPDVGVRLNDEVLCVY
tara:strand:+ start:256 stop:1131 length:876 start_codon:yes stop_codon:yes gene_type:complete